MGSQSRAEAPEYDTEIALPNTYKDRRMGQGPFDMRPVRRELERELERELQNGSMYATEIALPNTRNNRQMGRGLFDMRSKRTAKIIAKLNAKIMAEEERVRIQCDLGNAPLADPAPYL